MDGQGEARGQLRQREDFYRHLLRRGFKSWWKSIDAAIIKDYAERMAEGMRRTVPERS